MSTRNCSTRKLSSLHNMHFSRKIRKIEAVEWANSTITISTMPQKVLKFHWWIFTTHRRKQSPDWVQARNPLTLPTLRQFSSQRLLEKYVSNIMKNSSKIVNPKETKKYRLSFRLCSQWSIRVKMTSRNWFDSCKAANAKYHGRIGTLMKLTKGLRMIWMILGSGCLKRLRKKKSKWGKGRIRRRVLNLKRESKLKRISIKVQNITKKILDYRHWH